VLVAVIQQAGGGEDMADPVPDRLVVAPGRAGIKQQIIAALFKAALRRRLSSETPSSSATSFSSQLQSASKAFLTFGPGPQSAAKES